MNAKPAVFVAVTVFLGSAVRAAEDPDTRPLTSDQRAVLKDRLTEFRSLPADQQGKITDLHRAVSASTDDGARYRKLLDDYRRWLDTLTPGERQRIVDATTPEARIAVVRELVDSQAKSIAHDLEPIEHDRRPPNARRGSRFFTRPPEEFLAVSRALLPKLTESEKKKYESLSMRGRFPFMVALATKYDVAGEGMVRDSQPFIFDSVYQIVDNPRDRFAAASFSELTPENRQKFVQAVTEVMMLPDIDRRARFAFLDSQPKNIKDAIDSLSRWNPYGSQMLVNVLYYKQNPDVVPADLRDSLDVFSPAQAIERLARMPQPPDRRPDDRPRPPGPNPSGPPGDRRPENPRRFGPPPFPPPDP